MKTKLEMAHEYAIALINSDCEMQFDKFIRLCWNYADAMQAEADKRNKTEAEQKRTPKVSRFERSDAVKEVLNRAENMGLIKPKAVDEWQPDWSRAPDWANWWVATANQSGKITGGWFYNAKPEFGFGVGPSVYYSMNGNNNVISADSFGYTGDWRNSLRKRPE